MNRLLGLLEYLADFILNTGQYVVHVNDTRPKIAANPVANSGGRTGAHIGLDEDGEQIAEELFVNQPAFAFEQIANVGVEDVVGLLQRRAKHAKEAWRRRDLGIRRRRGPLPCPGG